MSQYFNNVSIATADMVYLDFGISLNQNTSSTVKLVTNYATIKSLNDVLSKLIFDMEAKQAEAAKSKN